MQPRNIETAFRQAMSRLAGTVCLVTSGDSDGAPQGIAATSVVSVSMAPPSLLVCIYSRSSLSTAIAARGGFCVNLLANRDRQLCEAFGDAARKDERFQAGAWARRGDLPYLRDAQAAIFCGLAQTVGHGSHKIFIGNVAEVIAPEAARQPLIYFNRGYATCARRASPAHV